MKRLDSPILRLSSNTSDYRIETIDDWFHLSCRYIADVQDSLVDQKEDSPSALRVTTIHNVKGETLDAIMLVSAPTAKGTQDGYWTQWIRDSQTEAARLAYVASSRPRHLLAWAIPESVGNAEKQIITDLGFKIIEMN